MDINEKLKQPLDLKCVRARKEGWGMVPYVESHYVIDKANESFGFLGWDATVAEVKSVNEELKKDETKKGTIDRWHVDYFARVVVTVRHEDGLTVRDDIGYGSGIDADKGRAHESAGKEAVSDATKRALRTFGDQFGLVLYDKWRNGEYIQAGIRNEAELERLPKGVQPKKEQTSQQPSKDKPAIDPDIAKLDGKELIEALASLQEYCVENKLGNPLADFKGKLRMSDLDPAKMSLSADQKEFMQAVVSKWMLVKDKHEQKAA